MEFEWDPEKSLSNKEKHGVDFSAATEIWTGLHITVNEIAKSVDGELRNATLGLIGSKVYLAVWTPRKGRVRLISVRRARDGEKEVFWKKTKL